MQHQVIINSKVLEELTSWFQASRPKEGYAFLAGRIVAPTVYRIDHIYMPAQKTSRNHVWISDEAKLDAGAWSLKNGSEVLGMAHSHIYPDLNHYGLMPSLLDAAVQSENHLTLSMILAFFGDRAALSCWLNGFAAPLDIRVRTGRKITDLPNFINDEK